MADDLHSSSRGIWILPYEPDEAGPSRPSRPLKQVYSRSIQAYRDAHEAYEKQKTEEQVDDIADWLDRSSTNATSRFQRLPVGIIQQPGKELHNQLQTAAQRLEVIAVQGRDLVDLASAMRIITTKLLVEVGSKTGLTGLDQVGVWWKKRKDSPTLLLHIQEAQIVSPQILAELIYIVTLHPNLPFRLLLSVPSVRTFLTQWSTIEPSAIDLTILSSRTRRRQNPVSHVLDIAGSEAKIRAGDDLVEKLKMEETMFGQGPEGALRSLQWSMLHHEANSPFATLLRDQRPSDLGSVKAILDALEDDPESAAPGGSLFELPLTKDLDHVLDPSPRISTLHALANTSSFTSDLSATRLTTPPPPATSIVASPKSTPRRSRKSQKLRSPSPPIPIADEHHPKEAGRNGDLKGLEVLYSLWKGAGKNVNLWDWLQGYSNSVTCDVDGEDEVEEVDEPARITASRKRPRDAEVDRAEDVQPAIKRPKGEAHDEDRLHASFVRFCEEARMLGLVRARGKGVGRRGDEVIKSVTLV